MDRATPLRPALRGMSMLVALVALFPMMTPASALASGGDSIATAQPLPLDTLVSGGGPPQFQYYRLPLTGGDAVTLAIDHEEAACQGAVTFRLFRPDVTDYQISDATPVQTTGRTSNGKHEYKWISPFTGNGVVQAAGCNTGIVPFTLIASLAHKTAVMVRGPSLARRGSTVRISAVISSPAGPPRGSCLIAGRAVSVINGGCSKRVRLGRGRKQTITVEFVPDDGWLAASGRRTVRLVRR